MDESNREMNGSNQEEEYYYVLSDDDDDESLEPRDTSEKDTSGMETSSELSSSPLEDDAAEAGPSCPLRSTGAIPKEGKCDPTSSQFPGPSSTQSDLGDSSDSTCPILKRSDDSPPEDVYKDMLERLAGRNLSRRDRRTLLPIYFRMLETMKGTETLEEQRDYLVGQLNEQTLTDGRATTNKFAIARASEAVESSSDDGIILVRPPRGKIPAESASGGEGGRRVRPGKKRTMGKQDQPAASQSEPDDAPPVQKTSSCRKMSDTSPPDSDCLPTAVKSGTVMGCSQLNPGIQSSSSKGNKVAESDNAGDQLQEFVASPVQKTSSCRRVGDTSPDSDCLPTAVESGTAMGSIELNLGSQSCSSKGSKVAESDNAGEQQLQEFVADGVEGLMDKVEVTDDSGSEPTQSEADSTYPATLTSSGDADTLESLSPSSSYHSELESETGERVVAPESTRAGKQEKRPAASSSDEEQIVSPREKLEKRDLPPSQSETGEKAVAPESTSAGKQGKRPAASSSDEEGRLSPKKKPTTEKDLLAPPQSETAETAETAASETPPGNSGSDKQRL